MRGCDFHLPLMPVRFGIDQSTVHIPKHSLDHQVRLGHDVPSLRPRTRSTGFACGAVHRDFLCHFSRAARRQICKQMQRLQMLQQNNKRNNKQGSSTTANKKRPDVLSSERFPHQRNNPRLRNHPFHTLQATPIAAAHDIRKISLLSEDSKSTLPDSPCFPQRIPRTFPHLLPSSGRCNVPHACSR